MANYREIIKSGVCLIDVWAPWCAPCRMMAPVMDELEKDFPNIKVCKANIDDDADIAMYLEVQYVPTFILMKDGVEVARAEGYMTKVQLIDALGL